MANRKKGRKIRYLKFRPYIDPITIRPYKPSDRGYYYKMYKGNIPLIRYTFEDNGFREATNPSQEWSIMWGSCNLKSEVYQTLRKYQKVNHFPKSTEITRKDCLYKNITKMQELYGYRHFDFIPKTFILPQDFTRLADEAEKGPQKFWIIKPPASSQGNGIFVTNNVLEIPTRGEFIASQYINDPLLIDGYKFDLRIYLLITSIEPLRLYTYEEGLVRFATCKYSPPMANNKNNKFIHLTNYSVNKYNANFIANDDPDEDGVGSKWSLAALKNYLEKHGINSDAIWVKIDEIMIKTVLSIEPLIKNAFDTNVPYKNSCFELLGFDIMLDSAFNPWLLEVNLTPSLNCDSPIDQKIKSELIADMFTMIRIVPLDQRNYVDRGHKTETAKFNPYVTSNTYSKSKIRSVKLRKQNTSVKKNILTRSEKEALRETESEYKKRGKFRRIFPTENYIYYKAFFEEERPLNTLISDYLLAQLAEKTEMEEVSKVVIARKAISKTKRVCV